MARLNADDTPLRIVVRRGMYGPLSRIGLKEKALRAWVGFSVDQRLGAKDYTKRIHRFSTD
jgi:hypothetical protein